MKCVLCENLSKNYICSNCYNNYEFKDIFNKIKMLDIDKDIFEQIILEITSDLKLDLKIYYQIISNFNKFYSISKDKRDWLIEKASICYVSDDLNNLEKNKIKCSVMEAYYRNYDFEKADLIASELINNDDIDYTILYQLGDFYITTRRYEVANSLLNKALLLCHDDSFKVTINNKLDNGLSRANGDILEYLPTTFENQLQYKDFMEKIGINIRIKEKAPKKISKEDYPKPIEFERAGFIDFVAFDIETTGIDNTKDSITELAAIKVRNGIIVETKEFIFQELVHPYKRSIPASVERITGITNEMVKDAREIWEVFPDFVEFCKDDILVGYNCMMFDSRFLVRAGRLSNLVIENKYFDVMKYAKKFKNELNSLSMKLNDVANVFGITNPNAHRALSDAITTAKLYLELLNFEKELTK